MSLVTKFFGSRFFHQRKGHQQMAREDYLQAVLGRMMGLEEHSFLKIQAQIFKM
jgi:hypothetical protein